MHRQIGAESSSWRRCTNRSSRRDGYSLLEVLIASVILLTILVATSGMLSTQTILDRRARGQREAVRSLEAQHEAIRGGLAVPLANGEHALAPVLEPGPPVENFSLTLEVEGRGQGLYAGTLIARYEIAGHPSSRRLEILFWRR
ncbi:MAG: prepilin-type N-terminal cleavage/methylation domain-containing protein [Acidobacteriota bacterium]